MASTKYLKKRGQSWSFQIAVPQALQGQFGRKRVVEALGTRDFAAAQKLAWPLVAEWSARFKRAETGMPLSPAEIEYEAREAYTAQLEAMEAHARLRQRSHSEEIENLDAGLDALLTEIMGPDPDADVSECIDSMTDFKYVAPDIAAVRRRKGLSADDLKPGTPTYNLLGRAFVRATVEALNGRLRKLRGKPTEPPDTFLGPDGVDPVTLRPITPAKRPAVRIRTDEGMRFSEASALYLAELQRDKNAAPSKQTTAQAEAVFRLFQGHADDAPLASVTRAMASDFLNTVAKLHPHWGRSPDTKQRSLSELLTEFGDKGEGLTNRTLNRYASALSCVWKWAEKRGHFDGRNPFANQGRKKAEGTGWAPYSSDELNKLFGAPLFKTLGRIKPSKHTVETVLQWAPLIALYSGMRLNEICQLRKGGVRREAGVWYFNVSEESEGQSIKTTAGIRKVPVHSALVRCGFLDYWKALPDGQLFPALKPGGPDGKLGWYFGKRYTDFRRNAGVNRPRVGFHSFRKNVATALDNAGVNRGDIAALIGHERGFTLETYSGGKGLKALRAITEKVQYPGLRISHLYV